MSDEVKAGARDASQVVKVAAKLVELLDPLTPDERRRAVASALAALGEPPLRASTASTIDATSQNEGMSDLPVRARAWTKQNDIAPENLEAMFHIESGKADFIGNVPGNSNKDRALNAYVLTGVRSLLSTGVATFADKEGRALCESAGCYDQTNHSKSIKGNYLIGSKEKGWSLTGPGLKHAAALINAGA